MSLPPRRAAVAGLAVTLAISVPFAASAPGASTAAPAPTAPILAPVENLAAAATLEAERFSARVVSTASKYKGTPYVLGGTTPRGFDCSGFTRYVFAKLHKKLPRTAQQQFNHAERVKYPRVGDLLFYHSGSRKGPVYHVVIYAGQNRVWHAPNPGTPVKKGKIYAKHWTAGRF